MDNDKLVTENVIKEEQTPNFDIDSSAQEVVQLYLDDIIPNRFQPRERFDENALKELAASIKQHGVIQPIIVRKIGDKYEIIAGERRYKASALAGLTTIPAIIRNLDDKETSKVALLENLQRKNLSAIEEARTYQKILDLDQMTQFDLAKTMGKSQPAVANKLRLLSLPDEVQDALLKEQISERHARSLLNVESEQEQIDLLHKIINNRMTVRELDSEIKGKINPLQGLETKIDNNELNKAEIKTEKLEENKFIAKEENSFDKLNSIGVEKQPTKEVSQPPLADLDELLKISKEIEKEDKKDFINPPAEATQPETLVPESSIETIKPVENETITPLMPTQPEVLNEEEPTREILENEKEKITKSTAIDKIDTIINEIKSNGLDISLEKMDFGSTYQIIIRINGED